MRAQVFFLLFILSLFPRAQERCSTNYTRANRLRSEPLERFEQWLQPRLEARASHSRLIQATYEIPVVFHVVHDGNEIGNGSNIAAEKIIEQVNIINEDFSRTNADASETPANFLSVAADTEIQFVLARQDPEGLPTSGIVRVQGSKEEYSSSDDIILMAESFWPQEDYLNIYVTTLPTNNLGFAQFPFSNLPGIASELENYQSTDGVVLDYKWVGNNDNTGSFDSRGRTATHEIGHYLGLRHIWGDGGCSMDDFCADTPAAANSTTGCPDDKTSCDSPDMFQNFMDYTNDVCMNLFTECQKLRMRTVLEQSPRRQSLLSSHGLNEPVLTTNDLGIRSISAPRQSVCDNLTTPGLQLRNYGSNNITSYEISLSVNDQLIETVSSSAFITSGATADVTFSAVTLDEAVTNSFVFDILSVNGQSDNNLENNVKTQIISPFNNLIIPFSEDFAGDPSYFTITEQGEPSMWVTASAPDTTTANQAALLPFYNQTANFGYQDRLITQTLDLSGLTSAQLDFSYAYAARTTGELDGLIVAFSTDCGESFDRSDFVFERYGTNLRTAGYSDFSFIPNGLADWDQVSLNVTQYAGQEDVQVAFMGVNGGGNNLYLDNISVTSANLLAYDVGIRTVEDLPVVTCEAYANPTVEIKNYGYEDINEIKFTMSINGNSQTIQYDNMNLPSGFSQQFDVSTSNVLKPGANEFTFTLSEVNGREDEQFSNNVRTLTTIVKDTIERIPVQENFESLHWTIADPGSEPFYEVTSVKGNQVLRTNSFENEVTGESYLVSPILITKGHNQAAIRFDYSYAERPGFNDNLKVLLSLDCGQTYDKELLSLNAEQLAVTTSSSEWVPESPEDWKQAFIDISEHLIWPELRVALVFSNGNGNRLYIDNVNVLSTNDPSLPEFDRQVRQYPNPAHGEFNLAFNLDQKEEVNIRITDMTGRVVFDEYITNIINQTLTLKAPSQSGFYMIQVRGNGINHFKRLYIRQ